MIEKKIVALPKPYKSLFQIIHENNHIEQKGMTFSHSVKIGSYMYTILCLYTRMGEIGMRVWVVVPPSSRLLIFFKRSRRAMFNMLRKWDKKIKIDRNNMLSRRIEILGSSKNERKTKSTSTMFLNDELGERTITSR